MNDLEKLFNGVSSDFFKHALKYVDFPPEDLEPSTESGEERSESSFRSLAPQISAVLASSPSGFNGGVGSDASERKPSISLNLQARVSAIETPFSRNTPRQNHYEDATGATRHSQQLVEGGKCSQCEITETTQWRQGPGGRTLCNACGMCYRSTGDPALQIDFPQDTTASNKTPNAGESSQGCKHLDASALESESHIPANAVRKKLRSRSELTSPSVAVAGKQPQIVRKCMHCGVVKTPQWRHGPMGRKTLCNACGVRYRSGDLAPEYRPAASPTFDPSLHSNLRSKVKRLKTMPELQTNREIIQTPPPPPGPLP